MYLFLSWFFFSAISTHLLQNVTAFCGFPASCTITVGQIISIGCAHNCSKSERQESSNVTAVGSAFLVLAGWPVSAKIAPEIPYHSPHSNLPGVQGVQLCYMQSLENTAFPIPWCEWIGLSLIHDIQWIFIFTVTSSSCQFANWNTTNRIYFKAILGVHVWFHCFAQTWIGFLLCFPSADSYISQKKNVRPLLACMMFPFALLGGFSGVVVGVCCWLVCCLGWLFFFFQISFKRNF